MAPSLPKTVKALKFENHGKPADVLQLVEQELPDVGDTQVAVKLLASSVNPSDNMTVMGLYPLQPADGIGGHEGVGEIVAAGSKVQSLRVGDRVIPAASGNGTWRTYGVYDEKKWQKIDSDLSLEDAATLLINPGTALLMLEEHIDLKPGDVVIQNGANSAVGQYVVSIAKQKGVKTINIVRDRPDWDATVKMLTDLGADLVATPDNVEEKAKEAGLQPILGFNCVGGEVATTMANMLKNNGTLVTYGAMTMEAVSVSAPRFIFNNIKLEGFWVSGTSSAAKSLEGHRKMIDRVTEMIKKAHIKADCEHIPLDQWQKAFEKNAKKALLVMD